MSAEFPAPAPAPSPAVSPSTILLPPARHGVRRFLGRLWRHRPAAIGTGIVLLFLFAAIPGFIVAVTGDLTYFPHRLEPSFAHPLGTDAVGRDVLMSMLVGAWTSLRVALIAVGISVCIGVPIGVVSGYFGGWIDLVLGRCIDTLMAFPAILLAMVIVAIQGQSLMNVTMAVGVVGAPIFARQIRSTVLVVRSVDFVTAARALGFTNFRILWRVILPNCLTPILVLATLSVGSALLEIAGLSFLGLSGDPDFPEWGRMLNQNQGELTSVGGRPLLVLAPGIGIFLSVLGFNLLGDGLRDLFDPKFTSSAKRSK